MSWREEREKERKNATYVYASSQGQRTNSSRTKIVSRRGIIIYTWYRERERESGVLVHIGIGKKASIECHPYLILKAR